MSTGLGVGSNRPSAACRPKLHFSHLAFPVPAGLPTVVLPSDVLGGDGVVGPSPLLDLPLAEDKWVDAGGPPVNLPGGSGFVTVQPRIINGEASWASTRLGVWGQGVHAACGMTSCRRLPLAAKRSLREPAGLSRPTQLTSCPPLIRWTPRPGSPMLAWSYGTWAQLTAPARARSWRPALCSRLRM